MLNTVSVENYCGRKPDEATCLFTAPGQVKTFGGSAWTEIVLERRTRGTVSGKICGPGSGDRAAGVLWTITGIIGKMEAVGRSDPGDENTYSGRYS